MALTSANDTTSNTALAEIKVAIIADAAVIVYIWDGVIAVVAVDRVYAHSWHGCLCLKERTRGRRADARIEPFIMSSCAGDWNLCVVHGMKLGELQSTWHSLVWASAAGNASDRWSRGVGSCESRVVDKELLESTLEITNGTRIHGRLGGNSLNVRDSCSRRNNWLENATKSWLFLHRLNWRWLFVLHCGRFGNHRCLVLHSNPNAKLELSLSSTIELLVDGGIGRIESYEGSGAVGITFEDSLGGRRN